MRTFRKPVLGAILLSVALFAAACGGSGGDDGDGGDSGGDAKPELTVGSDNFAESQIVAEMYAQRLEAEGYEVSRQLGIESREVRLPAMESGEIDIAPEYVYSLLSVVLPESEAASDPAIAGDPEALIEELTPELEKQGLELLEPSDVIDTNALVVTEETSGELGVEEISDLVQHGPDLTLGGPTECPERPLCLPGYEEVYGLEFGDFKSLEYGATITALQGGEIDVGLLFSTDGSIAENGFVLLEDDKNLQAADNIVPLVRSEVADEEVQEILNEVSAAIETDAITELNKRANVDVEDPADLATEYLEELGLLE